MWFKLRLGWFIMPKKALAKKTVAPVISGSEFQIQVQDIPVVNPNNVQSVYSNAVSIMNGQFDVRLIFNEIVGEGIGKPVQSILRANVTLTPAHAKAMSEALANAMEQYPKAFGEIPWPPKKQD
jgi:hypothetical protein